MLKYLFIREVYSIHKCWSYSCAFTTSDHKCTDWRVLNRQGIFRVDLMKMRGYGSRTSLRLFSTVSIGDARQSIAGRTRFYKSVDVEEVKHSTTVLDAGVGSKSSFKITLDKRTLRTPSGTPLHVPTIGLAVAIAEEWDAQKANSKRGTVTTVLNCTILYLKLPCYSLVSCFML